MDHTASYERVLPLPYRGAHLRTCILLYGLYGTLGILGAVWFLTTLSPYAIGLSALVEVALILCTRKYLWVEYEYSFFGGTLCVSKILGKSTRRVLCETELSRLILADYLTEVSMAAVLRHRPEEVTDARTVSDAPALILLWEDEDKTCHACILESDDRTETLLRKTRPEACSLPLKRSARQAKQ